MADFLLEIGLDEIPARMIAAAEAELGRRVNDLLARERLLSGDARLTTYSTPRRLAVLVKGVRAAQEDTEEKLTGPSWKVAFKDEAPTAAAEAFAKKAGVAIAALEKVNTPKGEYVGATVTRKGRTAADLIAAELPKEAIAIYWPKNMYWRAGKPERFVRPIRWVVALLDSEIVPLEIAGIAASNLSRGHRVLHGEASVVIASARAYAETLFRTAYVIPSVGARRTIIRKALDAATRAIPGARWREDESLVETVTHLTEWPTVVLGNFEAEYLALPEEVLVTVMRDHQKYFAVEDANGKLAPHFLTVLNTQVDEDGQAIIRHGNERVLLSRFKDAQFFWDVDQKTPLVDRVEMLKSVTFHKDLGSYWVKTAANERIADEIAKTVVDPSEALDADALRRAVQLAKADLTTELVKEFTELQGIIGGLYARAQGIGDKVAQAIYDQYTPATIEDPIPLTVEGQILGIGDRIQTIVAMFCIDLEPTGSRDPFALRRAANAVIKILAESELRLGLGELLSIAANQVDQSAKAETKLSKLNEFLRERLHFYLKEHLSFAYDVVNAVLAAGSDDVRDASARAEALTAVRGSDDFAAISIAFKRIKNILRQAEEKGFAVGSSDAIELTLDARQLLHASRSLAPRVAELRNRRAYNEALALIATLRPTVDRFFDKVMVLDSDPNVRSAHLGLIAEVLREFSTIADFSEILTS
jgi:glycyl-tRNA synthetase beta chain